MTTKQPSTKAMRRALDLLAQGAIYPAEAARLANVSRQAVDYWIQKHGIDHDQARRKWLAAIWRKPRARGQTQA